MDAPIDGFKWLVTNPEILGGRPRIRGTRLSTTFIVDRVAVDDIDEVLIDHPNICRKAVEECCQFEMEKRS
jgi:uncharacterized protein (DUF433 family)